MKHLKLFNKHGLDYVLIKYPYLVKKELGDIDVLLSEKYYAKSLNILKKEGFKVHTSEFKEKYKTIMVKYEKTKFIKYHLHRKVAWNGIIALDENQILKRKRILAGKYMPSLEDTLLINSAHVLLELKRIREYEKKLFEKIFLHKLDQKYIVQQLDLMGWRNSFNDLMKNKVSRKQALFSIICKKPYLLFNFFLHYFKAIISFVFRKKGLVIVLIGPDGSGKTTLSEKLSLFGFKTIYGGWKDHKLLTSKLLVKYGSTKQGLKTRKVFQNRRNVKITLLQELIYLNYTFEHYYRYFIAYINSRLGKNILFDRYFTDVFIQDSKSNKSKVLKLVLKYFPKPKFFFYLYSTPKKLVERKPDENTLEKVKSQQKEIANLSKIVNMLKINNNFTLDDTQNQILQYIWEYLI